MGKEIRRSRSVCPVCGKNLPAVLSQEPDGVIRLKKSCPEHGASGDGADAGGLRAALPGALRHLPGA